MSLPRCINTKMDRAENIANASELQQQVNTAAIAFLETEIETALTFAQVAFQAGNDYVKKRRNQENARKAYEAIMWARRRFSLTELTAGDREAIEDKLSRLKAQLEQLGEQL